MYLKLFIKYLLMYLPVIFGVILYVSGVVNLFSSLLLFLGGYIAIKNTLDYRLVKKNINNVKYSQKSDIKVELDNVSSKCIDRENIKSKNCDGIVGLKRVRRYSRVRRKY